MASRGSRAQKGGGLKAIIKQAEVQIKAVAGAHGHPATGIFSFGAYDIHPRHLAILPIMKQHGQHVHVDVKPLRRYEDFAADVKERAG